MKNLKATLMSKQYVSDDVCSFSFRANEGFDFVPGQYVILTIPGTPAAKRLYSFAGKSNSDNQFELLIKIVEGGVGTQYLKRLRVGDTVDASGPAGLFRQQQTPGRKIYMVTGTGYAPIRSFFLSSTGSLSNHLLFWGMRTLDETYLFDELLSLHKERGLSFYYCLSRESSFESIPAYLLQHYRTGHIPDVWQSISPDIATNDEYYLCGSRTVVESLRVLLLSRGVPKENLFFEKY
ncbi:MAG: FAD-dependent oxidoreductase [Microgenomates group bacterium]